MSEQEAIEQAARRLASWAGIGRDQAEQFLMTEILPPILASLVGEDE